MQFGAGDGGLRGDRLRTRTLNRTDNCKIHMVESRGQRVRHLSLSRCPTHMSAIVDSTNRCAALRIAPMTFRASTTIDASTAMAAEAAQTAVRAGLRYVSCKEPGIRRVRVGKGFLLLDARESAPTSPNELKRIHSLAVPPAYNDVWICVNPRGHLQATGQDARGRKQYRYHPDWRQVRDSAKFDRMIAFGEALPRLRRKLSRDLALTGLPREKVLAAVAALLDVSRARIGNAEYARDNKSFGLTTLRNRHVTFVHDGRAVLTFWGKGGVQHEIAIDDKRIVRIVQHCQELPASTCFNTSPTTAAVIRSTPAWSTTICAK